MFSRRKFWALSLGFLGMSATAVSSLSSTAWGANTQLVSTTITNSSGNKAAINPSMSADGSVVVFESLGDDFDTIVADNDDANPPHNPQNLRDVFIWEKNIGQVFLISLNDSGNSSGDGSSSNPVVSLDGDQVAFVSDADNLDYGPPPNVDGIKDHIYLYDVSGGTTKLITPKFNNTAGANGDSSDPSISNDGKVVFSSAARDLIDDKKLCDVNGGNDIYIYNGSALKLISKSKAAPSSVGLCNNPGDMYDNMTGNSSSWGARISRDGNYVVFVSSANDLISPAIETDFDDDIFLYDVQNDSVTMITKNVTGDDGADSPILEMPKISANGATVVFESNASDLTNLSDTGSDTDVFAWSQLTGIRLISFDSAGGADGNGASVNPSVSDDGTKVLFESNSSNLVTGFNNHFTTQVYLQSWLSLSPVNEAVSVSLADPLDGGDGSSFNSRISGDGNNATFQSTAINMTGGSVAPDGQADVFLRDLTNKVTFLMSPNGDGTGGGDLSSQDPVVTADGRYVLFQSAATDFFGLGSPFSDSNAESDIFLGEQPGFVRLNSATYNVNESGPTITITVERLGGAGGDISIDYTTVQDTATEGSDYSLASGTLNFANGETSKTFDVSITDDPDFEGDEVFKVKLSNPVQCGLGSPSEADVTIQDNDENCTNGIDDNSNGQIDCQDSQCASDPSCVEVCNNSIDDDQDGQTDCDDSDCAAAPGCFEICNNGGIDDDNNGSADCLDSACSADPVCTDPASDGDGDGVANGSDNCAAISNPGQEDTDNDGIGNACDTFENDCSNGISDDDDAAVDCGDSNCAGDPACTDTDTDGIPDSVDNCLSVANPLQEDTDGDGIGNACDTTEGVCNNGKDDDNDGDIDCADSECAATIICNNPSGDDDSDGVLNGVDNCPSVANAGQQDTDGDGLGNACDDAEGDCTNGVSDDNDADIDCADSDCSALPGCQDGDSDGLPNYIDNCDSVSNPGQEDTDGDGIGNACDTVEGACGNSQDDDNDGNVDCADSDCTGSPACADDDSDGVLNGVDNCPSVSNAGQEDTDNDGIGNVCDGTENDCTNGLNDDDDSGQIDCDDTDCSADPACIDTDGDGVTDNNDNCPSVSNSAQDDSDGDGIGNACDPEVGQCNNGQDDDGDGQSDCSDSDCASDPVCTEPSGDADGDGVANATDNCPDVANPDQADTDGDGFGDLCDSQPNIPGGGNSGGGSGNGNGQGNGGGGAGPGAFPGDPRGGGGFGCSVALGNVDASPLKGALLWSFGSALLVLGVRRKANRQ